MKRAAAFFIIILGGIIVVALLIPAPSTPRPSPQRQTNASTAPISTDVQVTEISAATAFITPSSQSPPLLGVTILRDYANTNLPAQNDLTLMSHLIDNSLLLLKSAANRPLSANEDWADFLRGKNSARERFLPDQHIALNTNGQLVDRWGTPLFFHAVGNGRFEIRSAGPDRKLWTDDDIHRNSDGTFRHGTNLNPSALY